MGIYLNPGSEKLEMSRRSEIYIDKSGIISVLNSFFDTENRFVCVSRPRRFGKSMTANMISAYYDRTVNGEHIFAGMHILASEISSNMNSCDVVFLNMQEFLSDAKNDMDRLISNLKKAVTWDLQHEYPDVSFYNTEDFSRVFSDVYLSRKRKFVFIIDEWDCIFREYQHDAEAQKKYLDFLRDWMKDKAYIGLAYMTGILPIKKYGTHSALNMFTEYSMENPRKLSQFVGFTESEVKPLCDKYDMDFEECKAWYDGYYFRNLHHVYNPNSIVKSMMFREFDDYWNQTETYDALRVYIDMNFDGLRDSILKLMAGGRQRINTKGFQNDMTSFSNADNVMTLLVHLGYLGYDFTRQEVFIPNREIMQEFVTATTTENSWNEVLQSVRNSDELLKSIWNGDEGAAASYIESAHLETSHLQYNDENAHQDDIFA